MNPDRLAELEEERRFLLRSLTDLEREFHVGDVEQHDYETLRDGYTSRAATVLRTIQDGHANPVPRQPRRAGRMLAGVAVVISVAAGGGWLVARASGQRLNGDSITGGTSPDRIAVLLSQARSKLGADSVGASNLYLQVLDLDPNNAEARTYTGWLLAISTRGQPESAAAATLAAAKETLNKAIASDPTYADPYCFLAVIAGNFEENPQAAQAPAQSCLDNNPPAQMRDMIESFAAELDTPITVSSDSLVPTATT